MSTALVMMVRDEVDIIESFLRHSATHVDAIYAADHGSSDGTREMLSEFARDLPLVISDLEDPGYWQSRFISELAQKAFSDGHSWAIAADADECWYVKEDPTRRIADYLDGLAPDVQVATAEIINHIPSAADDEQESNPLRRIVWRKREPAPVPKVCCRLHPTLVVEQGNHQARYGANGAARFLSVPGLALRHFSWRTPEQYARKIVIGRAAYAATRLPDDVGVHWRMWEGASEEEIEAHFREWFWSADPETDDSLVYDPAPVR